MKGRITQLGHWGQGRSRTALGYSPVGDSERCQHSIQNNSGLPQGPATGSVVG
jgi:hypothetical protein